MWERKLILPQRMQSQECLDGEQVNNSKVGSTDRYGDKTEFWVRELYMFLK